MVNELGFETPVTGTLLKQIVNFKNEVGIAYERCIGYSKDFHVHNRVNLTFPRASAIIYFNTINPKKQFTVDERSFLWMPSYVEHNQSTLSMIYDNFAIFPSNNYLKKVLKNLSNRYIISNSFPHETIKKTRTVLLNELLNAYFIETILEHKDPIHLSHLSSQILEEVLRIIFSIKRKSSLENSHSDDKYRLSKAFQFIEGNLFHKLTTKLIAEKSGISSATLFREFQKEFKISPGEYITKRRLDESLILIKQGHHTISDIAYIVGYSDLASFSKSFKSRFGKSPKNFA